MPLQPTKEPDFEELEQSRTYKIFKMAIKSPKTLYQYRFPLREFLRYSSLASYDELITLDTNKIEDLLEDWIMGLSERGVKGNSIRGKLAPIELFLEMNRIVFHKKILHKLIPREEGISGGDVPFTTDEIKRMLECTKKLRTKAFVHFLASTGIRPGALIDPVLRRKHLVEMPDNCLAIRVYDNSKEGYWAFLTPEARKSLYAYFDARKLNGEILTDDSPIFVNEVTDSKYGHLSYNNLKTITHKLLRAAAIVRTKNGNRYDKAANYGFRKRFNGILKMNNNVNSNIAEKLMAHKKGLDGSYLKPTREECFAEFKKAIADLTIDDSERDKIKIEKLESEKSELEKNRTEISDMKRRLEEVECDRKARYSAFARSMLNHDLKNDSVAKILSILFHVLFEMSAPEEEKRRIWKRALEAAERGEMFDLSWLGDPKNFSLSNFFGRPVTVQWVKRTD